MDERMVTCDRGTVTFSRTSFYSNGDRPSETTTIDDLEDAQTIFCRYKCLIACQARLHLLDTRKEVILSLPEENLIQLESRGQRLRPKP